MLSIEHKSDESFERFARSAVMFSQSTGPRAKNASGTLGEVLLQLPQRVPSTQRARM